MIGNDYNRKHMLERHDVLRKITDFVTKAHDGQYRKDGVTPYSVHPMRCAMFAMLVFKGTYKKLECLMLFHDVLEDCDEQYKKEAIKIIKSLKPYFHDYEIDEILYALKCITKPDKVKGINRQKVLEIYMDEVVTSNLAICGKLVDRIDNLKNFEGVTDKFMLETYLPESYYILNRIESAGCKYDIDVYDLFLTLNMECDETKKIYEDKVNGVAENGN